MNEDFIYLLTCILRFDFLNEQHNNSNTIIVNKSSAAPTIAQFLISLRGAHLSSVSAKYKNKEL